ncbi:hypothetical protein [Pseudomonas paeninsulae]|uniref:hypothetical protein n=1 Tax=Pseudomonas paeninsulae TaxID=3110772 RepID=UPI002D788B6F|nr:hypothetical protein [Pseudomonas sp. IT1137]
MNITNMLLANVFSDSGLFCGKEDVVHAIIHHQLVKSGISSQRIAREQALSGNRVDIVLFGDGFEGDFATTQSIPVAAVEVKGGAYGYRNALKVEIDANGYCADMAKLRDDAAKGIECWFFCVDMAELGRAISPHRIELISAQSNSHGLSFAYYCQGEDFFYVSRPKQKLTQAPIAKKIANNCKPKSAFELESKAFKLDQLARECLAVTGHEANTTARLYHRLRDAGFGAEQLSLETYFSFAAPAGSRMQERPDLVVFSEGFDGRFNLYRGGDMRQSNDAHKLAHIDTIFEVKAGAALDKKGDKAVMQAYLNDIHKLVRWRDGAASARKGTRVKTMFMGVDGRSGGLPVAPVTLLVEECRKNSVGLIYISRDRVETVQP